MKEATSEKNVVKGLPTYEMVLVILKELRLSRGLTQKHVAGVIGKSSCGYSLIETGKRSLSMDDLFKLANFYRTCASELFKAAERYTILVMHKKASDGDAQVSAIKLATEYYKTPNAVTDFDDNPFSILEVPTMACHNRSVDLPGVLQYIKNNL